jgi:two-component system sensor histidine kinase RegB
MRSVVQLRWVAIAGQLATLVTLRLIGAADLQMVPLLLVEGVFLASNAILFAFRRAQPLSTFKSIAAVLVFDTLLLTALLAFSGGPMNPYTVFFLVHIVMAAVLLGGTWTWLLVALCTLSYASLFLLVPISMHHMHMDGFAAHLYGMLSSFVIASICTGYFVFLIQRDRDRAERMASVARDAAARAESFASLTAVAAGAAHELGTPLGTIAVAARELERAAAQVANGERLAEDARLIREEVDRCRTILDALSPPFPGGDDPAHVSPQELIDILLQRIGTAAHAQVKIESVAGSTVRLPRHRTAQAATALLQNALDADDGDVAVQCRSDTESLVFKVDDRGPGMSAAVQSRLGEPFFSTKPQGRGLGLFLVRQFVEQVGGRLTIESAEGKGTRVTMVLPTTREQT